MGDNPPLTKSQLDSQTLTEILGGKCEILYLRHDAYDQVLRSVGQRIDPKSDGEIHTYVRANHVEPLIRAMIDHYHKITELEAEVVRLRKLVESNSKKDSVEDLVVALKIEPTTPHTEDREIDYALQPT